MAQQTATILAWPLAPIVRNPPMDKRNYDDPKVERLKCAPFTKSPELLLMLLVADALEPELRQEIGRKIDVLAQCGDKEAIALRPFVSAFVR